MQFLVVASQHFVSLWLISLDYANGLLTYSLENLGVHYLIHEFEVLDWIVIALHQHLLRNYPIK